MKSGPFTHAIGEATDDGRESALNKYKKLVGNTLIFAIGSFSSKLLTFLLVRFHTGYLTQDEYGVANLITNTANLIAPFAMLAINEAVIRFVIDGSGNRRQVFSAGLMTTLGGTVLLALCMPLIGQFDAVAGYTWLIFAFVLSNNLRGLCASFVRGSGYVRLYAFDGVLTTLTTVTFNILFMAVFGWGVTGMVSATMAANLLSVAFFFWAARLYRFIRPLSVPRELYRAMYRYCVPLIPTTMFWWITNVSDQFLITHFHDRALTGLYATAYKIPSLLTVASAIFYQAWLLSAVGEYDDPHERNRFYSRVTQIYVAVVFLAGAGIMLLTKPIMHIMVDPSFFEAYRFVPFLLLAEVFSTFVTFFGAFYAAAKKNTMVPLTILMGAVINVALNIALIPKHGAQGAAFATFISYLVVFVVRLADVQRFVRVQLSLPVLVINFLLLLGSAYLVFTSGWTGYAGQVAIGLVMLLVNLRTLMPVIRALLGRVFAVVGK